MINRTLRLMVLSLVAAGLVGCAGNGREGQLHGNSTRHADAAQDSAQQPPAQQQEQHRYQAFGEKMKLDDSQAMHVSAVLANPAAYEGKYVRLVGDVNKVCTRKGCWLEMADTQSKQPLFVKFTCPVEGRLIPMEAIGKPVVVEGIVKVQEISEEDARHLKEESGASDEEVAKIQGPQKQITLESPSARVAGL